MRKLTQEEAEEKVLKKCKEMNYELVEPFIYTTSKKTILKLRCPKDGYEWNISYDGFKKTGCPKCGGPLKYTQEEMNNIVFKKCLEMNYILDEPFTYIDRNQTKIKLKCSKNHKWEVGIRNIQSTICKDCLKENSTNKKQIKKTNDEFIQELVNIYGDEYNLSHVIYKGWDKKVKLVCPIHGDFYKKPRNLLKYKSGCNKCVKENADNKQRKSYNNYYV